MGAEERRSEPDDPGEQLVHIGILRTADLKAVKARQPQEALGIVSAAVGRIEYERNRMLDGTLHFVDGRGWKISGQVHSLLPFWCRFASSIGQGCHRVAGMSRPRRAVAGIGRAAFT
jgi:hypothetical protein